MSRPHFFCRACTHIGVHGAYGDRREHHTGTVSVPERASRSSPRWPASALEKRGNSTRKEKNHV